MALEHNRKVQVLTFQLEQTVVIQLLEVTHQLAVDEVGHILQAEALTPFIQHLEDLVVEVPVNLPITAGQLGALVGQEILQVYRHRKAITVGQVGLEILRI